MLSLYPTFLGNLRWSFPIELNLITQKNSQSGAHSVHERKKNAPFVSAWWWPQVGTGASYVFAQGQSPKWKVSWPQPTGGSSTRFWEAGALWAWKAWIILHCTDPCNTCMGKSSEESTVGMSAVVTSGRCVLDFNFLIYVYCYFVVIVWTWSWFTVSFENILLAERSLTSLGPHVPWVRKK